jgi:hypothetical protein
MKKGLFTLAVAVLTLVGVVGYGAVPEVYTIPDVIIGDAEAPHPASDNYFVYPDAFDFDDYLVWASTGTVLNYHWLYDDALPTDAITVNGLAPAVDANVYAVSDLATFRNVLCSPIGGPYTLNPVGTSTPVLCDLTVSNYVLTDTDEITVYTIDEANDELMLLVFERVDLTSVTMLADPGWAGVIGYTVSSSLSPPFGLRPATGDWSGTTGCYYLETTGYDNDFGFFSMLDPDLDVDDQVATTGALIPYTDEAVYVVEASLFGVPIVTQGQIDFYGSWIWRDLMPQIRIRLNTANESVSSDMVLPSLGQRLGMGGGIEVSEADLVVTTDPANPRVSTLVFDPRDQASPDPDYAALYFSFDLLDFSAQDRSYYGELDEEGLVGIVNLDVDTLPLGAFKPGFTTYTLVRQYPLTGDYNAEYDEYLHFGTGFGGTAVEATTKTTNLLLKSENVDRGFGGHQLLNASTHAISVDPDKWYQYKFYVKNSNYDIPFLRLRVFLTDEQRTVSYNVGPTFVPDGNWNGYQFAPDVGATARYNVFFVPPTDCGTQRTLGYGIDLIDFDPLHGDSEVELTKVQVYDFPTPVHAAP